MNLAQRIEGANRGFGTDILAAAATARQSGNRIEWQAVSTTAVPGRREPVTLFERTGLKAGPAPLRS